MILEPDSEVLLTIAELCLALIGFSGVVSVFGRRNSASISDINLLILKLYALAQNLVNAKSRHIV